MTATWHVALKHGVCVYYGDNAGIMEIASTALCRLHHQLAAVALHLELCVLPSLGKDDVRGGCSL